ncbi:hypothetical protein B0H14DRAFT_3566282 [Mycena olivaceomarginata]|nr:hypothetical protein B0H14DRAFT_3567704 [Mycena olivaceomarginata]KAJ7791734.1 hypothetical protein B0H14DRAFT_3566282 [Mycena olivaceomarginata]
MAYPLHASRAGGLANRHIECNDLHTVISMGEGRLSDVSLPLNSFLVEKAFLESVVKDVSGELLDTGFHFDTIPLRLPVAEVNSIPVGTHYIGPSPANATPFEVGRFLEAVPTQVIVPSWAYLDVTKISPSQLRAIIFSVNFPSTSSTAPPSTSSVSLPSSPTTPQNSNSNAGPIAGGCSGRSRRCGRCRFGNYVLPPSP